MTDFLPPPNSENQSGQTLFEKEVYSKIESYKQFMGEQKHITVDKIGDLRTPHEDSADQGILFMVAGLTDVEKTDEERESLRRVESAYAALVYEQLSWQTQWNLTDEIESGYLYQSGSLSESEKRMVKSLCDEVGFKVGEIPTDFELKEKPVGVTKLTYLRIKEVDDELENLPSEPEERMKRVSEYERSDESDRNKIKLLMKLKDEDFAAYLEFVKKEGHAIDEYLDEYPETMEAEDRLRLRSDKSLTPYSRVLIESWLRRKYPDYPLMWDADLGDNFYDSRIQPGDGLSLVGFDGKPQKFEQAQLQQRLVATRDFILRQASFTDTTRVEQLTRNQIEVGLKNYVDQLWPLDGTRTALTIEDVYRAVIFFEKYPVLLEGEEQRKSLRKFAELTMDFRLNDVNQVAG